MPESIKDTPLQPAQPMIERVVVTPPDVKVYVQLPDKRNALFEVGTYAPALPGLLVALFGLWAAHELAQRRDRKKAVYELCETLKSVAEKAASIATEAWLEGDNDKRVSAVASSKRILQSAGVTATTLKRRTLKRRSFAWVECSLRERIKSRKLVERKHIDVTRDVYLLRREATEDPFEDPTRASYPQKADSIAAILGTLCSNTDRALIDYQG